MTRGAIVVNIFIIGSKGIPAQYGGFETFADKLTAYKKSENIKYHVACISDSKDEFEYNGARCFKIRSKYIGSPTAVIYDIKALEASIKYIEKHNLNNCIIYLLACRIGPALIYYKKKLQKLGIKLYLNPDGHEWKRKKWNFLIKSYWKYSEKLTVKLSDLVICDSKAIEQYIKVQHKKYKPNTAYLAYGADLIKSEIKDGHSQFTQWLYDNKLKPKEYYLMVSRFVPENNYEIIIKEFMKSSTKKDLVIVANVMKSKFYNQLLNRTKFNTDNRIKFVGTVYDQELLKKIREEAYAYIHGHEVGGTNPSLLEALASTNLNIILDVNFNKEVAGDENLYFNKSVGSLLKCIEACETMGQDEIEMYGNLSKNRVKTQYSWDFIVNEYEKLFQLYGKE
jgi:rhamnosyltransferase